MLAKADSDEYREKLEKVVDILEDAIAKGTASSDSAGASTTGKKKKKKKKN
jgi:L-serine deaminase